VEEGGESGDEGGGDELVGEVEEVMCLRKRAIGKRGVRGDGGSHRRSVSGVCGEDRVFGKICVQRAGEGREKTGEESEVDKD